MVMESIHAMPGAAPNEVEREYLFGPFRFTPARQRLACGDTPVRVGSRALEILAVLTERAGEVVSKRELIARAWPSSVVEDGNLKVQLSALRRALDQGQRACGELATEYVATVTGRGYRFVAPVSLALPAPRPRTGPQTGPQPERAGVPAHNLPTLGTRAIGRADAVSSLLGALGQRRIVTVVGPGGIGKTTVALAVAEAALQRQGRRICFVDLGPARDAQCVAQALAAALGLALGVGDPVLLLLLAGLRDAHMLLVLDSCDHVLEASALLAELVVAHAPGVSVLATSREPLRVGGESVHRLAPLACPPAGAAGAAALSASQALAFGALRLFVERAAECRGAYRLDDGDAPAVAEICRRLEGLALAIELAATRLDALGARELAARLDERYRLLARGRHTLLRRHRTLAAALDWSYDFLPKDERLILRALSVFAGPFTLDAATLLVAGGALTGGQVVYWVTNLVEKSLLAVDPHGAVVLYRLFGTTRAYALDKLEADGEAPEMRRRLARINAALDGRADVRPGFGSPLPAWPGGIPGRAPRIALRAKDGIAVPGSSP